MSAFRSKWSSFLLLWIFVGSLLHNYLPHAHHHHEVVPLDMVTEFHRNFHQTHTHERLHIKSHHADQLLMIDALTDCLFDCNDLGIHLHEHEFVLLSKSKFLGKKVPGIGDLAFIEHFDPSSKFKIQLRVFSLHKPLGRYGFIDSFQFRGPPKFFS